MSRASDPQSAEVAHAMSSCMNILFLFAAPRVFASVRSSSPDGLDRTAVAETLRRFLKTAAGIRSRSSEVSEDVGRVMQAAAIVEEICGALPSAKLEDGLPSTIVEPARRTLAVLGFPGPQQGWDDFEGFEVPQPPYGRG
ncbi:hypothetical protein [Polyangium aurulentum]|uniref:hypothetical protein n=1 Tax=Polyangium aurulentum TaxID=2567896 RepID=UPI00146AF224|nr:hypothetical protein [Polyangium aurulentum]UQA61020.1 hypothetical protein E8A73_011300 [Polyangium aurulentum]